MKLKKILAAVAAAAVATSALAINSFAALLETSLEASGAPDPNAYLIAGVEGVDYSKVAKIEAVVTTSDYVNGTIGVSVGGTWTTPGQLEANAGTSTWTLDGLSGIDSTDDAGALKADVAQVQFWWLNAGSVSLDSLKLLDADGNVLQEGGAEAAAPADEKKEEAPAADVAYNVNTVMVMQDNATWTNQKSAEVAVTGAGEYTYKLDGLSIDPTTVTVLYIKDAKCVDETASGYQSDIGEIALEYKSLKINGTDVAVKDGAQTAIKDGIFDFALYNTWADSFIDLPTDTITSVELTVGISAAAAAPTDDTQTAEAPEAEDVDEPEAEEPEAEDVDEPDEVEEPEAEEPAEAPAETEAPAAETATPAPATGNTAVASIVAVMAVAGAAAIVAKKRK